MGRNNGETSDQELLQTTVIEHSQADDWINAKKEWNLKSIFDRQNHCVCKHFIIENCVIRNRITNRELIVGNVCVNHFKEETLSVRKESRDSLKKIHSNPSGAKANKWLIEVAVRLNIITKNEGKNYQKTSTKMKQHQWKLEFRKKINALIRYGFTNNRPKCECDELAKPRQNSRTKQYFYSCYYGNYNEEKKWEKKCNFNKSID